MSYSRKRQRFLINQGYSYKVVTHLAGMDDERLNFGSKEEQMGLLQQIIMASDKDFEEEELPFEATASGSGTPGGSGDFLFTKKEGSMSSLSGVSDAFYAKVPAAAAKSSKVSQKERHPLFKKFRK